MLRQVVLFEGEAAPVNRGGVLEASGIDDLWESNGTAGGTVDLAGINGTTGLFPSSFGFINGIALFDGEKPGGGGIALWETNGTTAGTFALTGISGALLFDGPDASGQAGLWVTNGTVAGTSEISGTSGVAPSDLTLYNGKVLFDGYQTLFVTNGTAAGTQEITGISGAPTSLYPSDMTVYNGKVLFDGAGGQGLWVTNGTAAGTQALTGISGAGSDGLFLEIDPEFTVINGEVVFAGTNTASDVGLWVTNGTAAGTPQINGIGNGE